MQVEQIRGRSFNYRFSPAERQMGRELLCPNGENSIHPRLSTHTPSNQSGGHLAIRKGARKSSEAFPSISC